MNTYKKFCPNVFVAQCEEEHQKGDVITLTTKYGKEHECVVHNYLGETVNGRHLYSITRLDGLNAQTYAQNKAEKLQGYSDNAKSKSDEWYEKSNEGRDFLKLAEPIKVGHHSEKRHRALIQRNWDRMSKSMELLKKSQSYNERIEYWESKAKEINLSMPESLEFFKVQLDEAKEYHKGLKDGTIKREHSYSLTYAKKRVNDLTKKYETATLLWGVENKLTKMNKFKNGKIGEKIRSLRKSKGISIVGLARELNVSRQTIYLWENGSSTPTADKWEELKVFLDWSENEKD